MTPLLEDDGDQQLLRRVSPELHESNGIPNAQTAARRTAAARLVEELLAQDLVIGGLRVSPLGPGWSRDIDCHVSTSPDPVRLRGAGWLHLGPLLTCLGRDGADRWVPIQNEDVLVGVDLHRAPPPAPLEAVLRRCVQRGEVRIREVLELRTLIRDGVPLPDNEVVRTAADVEHGLGGDLLRKWRADGPRPGPAQLHGRPFAQRWRRRWAIARDASRPRLVVALSGMDGAGKSSLAEEIAIVLERIGVPTSRVWTRPGMSISAFAGVRRILRRRLGEADGAGVRRRGADPDAQLRTRTGVLGAAWSQLVTTAFLREVWRQHLQGRGVVIHDRHVLDALVTLDVVYGGTDLRVQRLLVRSMLPRADLTVLVEVDPETALLRKPDDLFGLPALVRQGEAYQRYAQDLPRMRRLPSDRPPDVLAAQVVRWLLDEVGLCRQTPG